MHTHTRLDNVDGHICATLDQFDLPSSLQILANINSYSTVFPTKQKFIEGTTKTFQVWLQKHGFPSHDTGAFHTCQQQWSRHLQELKTTPRLTIDHISSLK